MGNNRPYGHRRNVTGEGKSVFRRGGGLGNGKVGGGSMGGFGSGGNRSGGGKSPFSIIILLIVLLLGGGGGLSGLLNGGGLGGFIQNNTGSGNANDTNGGNSSSISAWNKIPDNRGKLNTKVSEGVREKFVDISNNQSTTIMVYMCGTDLESKYGMATNDIQEMLKANLGSSVNLILYTGGTNTWKNSVISNRVNQIYQVKDGGILKLGEDGEKSMTDPNTLSGFIAYCKQNFPANRNQLIFWDHGGGSVTGFGYDEKFAHSGSMNLSEIRQAVASQDIKFDFIGFDACLMATTENALALSDYADYLIASEETEPGTGWYYTNWLTELAQNPNKSTLEIGKKLIDDFIDVSNVQARGQLTTLSLVDLAEVEARVPKALKEFSNATSTLLANKEYAKVVDARNITREFAKSSKIDQVDLVNLASNLNTPEANTLAQTILDCVKYNRACDTMTNSYGLSIYFPSKRLSKVDTMVDTYEEIGMEEAYSKCIQEYASIGASGQAVSGGNSSPLESLTGSETGGISSELIGQLLGAFLNGNISGVAGLDAGNTEFLSQRNLSDEMMIEYIKENHFDMSQLKWTNKEGEQVLSLPKSQWALVQKMDLNAFIDDGEGYIDLGLDNVFTFDKEGDLIADTSSAWIAVDSQPVAYYHIEDVKMGEDITTVGRVPVLLNGTRANLIIIFDKENPDGYIAGARVDYIEGETDTIAKSTLALEEGDILDFLCDYYTYEGQYQDSYKLGEAYTVGNIQPKIQYVTVKESMNIMYRLEDLYGSVYWTPVIGK